MNRLFIVVLLLGPLVTVHAQSGDVLLAGSRQPVQISILPLYQQVDHDRLHLSELSIPIAVYIPVHRSLGVQLRAGQATVQGDSLASLRGVTDVQAGLSYYRDVGAGSVVLSLGLNLPSGTQTLSREGLETMTVLSRNLYDYQVPHLGQGFGVAPGVTWALPLRESLVMGLGVSYQHRGAFEPVEGMPDRYQPGDEWLFTGGIDVRLTRVTTLSADLTYTFYGRNTIGGTTVLDAGRTLVATVQFRHYRGFDELWFWARYRSRARNGLSLTNAVVGVEEGIAADQGELIGRYRLRVGQRLDVSVVGEGRFFAATPTLSSATVFGLGLAPALALSPRLRIPVRATYLFGTVSGFEAGIGVVATL